MHQSIIALIAGQMDSEFMHTGLLTYIHHYSQRLSAILR